MQRQILCINLIRNNAINNLKLVNNINDIQFSIIISLKHKLTKNLP